MINTRRVGGPATYTKSDPLKLVFDFHKHSRSSMHMGGRILPSELECYIFELAAEDSKSTMLPLILVARRAQIWHVLPVNVILLYNLCCDFRIEPLLYRTIRFSQEPTIKKFLRTMDSNTKPPGFFAKCVKSVLFIFSSLTEAKGRILSVCTGIVNLFDLHNGDIPFSSLSGLRLERIHANLQNLKGFPPDYFTLPAFQNVTHLEIFDYPTTWPSFQFGLLPSLTHLSIMTWALEEWDDTAVRVLSTALDECRSLQLLVLHMRNLDREESVAAIRQQLIRAHLTDPRLVLLHTDGQLEGRPDWLQHAREEWERAEKIAADQTHRLELL